MDYEAGEFDIEGINYHIRDKSIKRFLAYANMELNDKKKCFEFAYGMSYGEEGAHRDHRTGGGVHRRKGQIFINVFQGKMAEFALYRYLKSKHIEINEPDISRYELGKWDTYDLLCQGKYISVKSTKSYGNLLLLETKDWNVNGDYIPNLVDGKNRSKKYDYTVLVRFKPDGEKIMNEKKLLNQKNEEIPKNIKEILAECIGELNWQYDFPGFIYYSELVKMIREKRIIPRNTLLNGQTKMDAENYYFLTGNMHSINELYTKDINEKVDERADLRLKRKCPKCGKELVLRKGTYGWFWGCQGYFEAQKCRYTEPVERNF